MGPIKLVGAQVDFSAGLKLEFAYMLIPLVQAVQTLAELHEIFVWRFREEFERQPLAFYDD